MAEMTQAYLNELRKRRSRETQNLIAAIDELSGGLETALSMLNAGCAKDPKVSAFVAHWSATLARLGMGAELSDKRDGGNDE